MSSTFKRTEKSVFVAYRAAYGTPAAKPLLDRIVLENIAFVHMMCRRFQAQWNLPIPKEDLVQAGIAGMVRCLQTYDPARSKFTTWAGDWIRFYHQELARLEGYRIKKHVPSAVMRDLNDFRARMGRNPTPEELGVPEALHAKAVAPSVQFVPLEEAATPALPGDTRLALSRGLAKLPKKVKRIFLAYADNPDTKALAKEMGVLEIQVLDAVDHARKVLRMELP